MIVIGGTYDEIVRDPSSTEVRGSGLRAAAVLAGIHPQVQLVSAVPDQLNGITRSITSSLGISDSTWSTSTRQVSFTYDLSISHPVLHGRDSTCVEAINIDGDKVLVFGMVEGGPTISCNALVVDPQHSLKIADMAAFDSVRLAIVANSGEIRELGHDGNLEVAARNVISELGADVVVVKLGALGAIVVTSVGPLIGIGPTPTEVVHPVGSGDAFSAGFAWAWTEAGMSPEDAARVGMSSAAAWCREAVLPLPVTAFGVNTHVPLRTSPKIYLAGPFFDVGQRWVLNRVRSSLLELGAQVFSPLHDVGLAVPESARLDLEGLDECDGVLALLDGLDTGTVFEIGWARHSGTPVVAYSQRAVHESLTMLSGTDVDLQNDLATAIYRSIWVAS